MNWSKIRGVLTAFLPLIVGGLLMVVTPAFFGGWHWRDLLIVAITNLLAIGAYRWISGEWPWEGPKFKLPEAT